MLILKSYPFGFWQFARRPKSKKLSGHCGEWYCPAKCLFFVVASLSMVMVMGCERPAERTRNVRSENTFSLNFAALPNGLAIYVFDDVIKALTTDGQSVWHKKIPSGKVIAPIAGALNSTVYVRTARAIHLYSHAGELIWSHGQLKTQHLPDPQILAPVALSNSAVAFAMDQREVLTLNIDGSVKWKIVIPQGKIISQPVAYPNGGLLIGTTKGIYNVSPDGQIVWHSPIKELQFRPL